MNVTSTRKDDILSRNHSILTSQEEIAVFQSTHNKTILHFQTSGLICQVCENDSR